MRQPNANAETVCAKCPVRLCVGTSLQVVMQELEAQRVKRSQRDYSLAFKLAVVGEVARGELGKK